MPSYTLDLDRRTEALIELLDCPVRWASKEYVMSLASHLVMRCEDGGRFDLCDRIINHPCCERAVLQSYRETRPI